MSPPPDVSVVIANWNTSALLERCLGSIARARAGLSVETIVIDNASTDGSAAMVRRSFPGVALIVNDTNVGFAAATNRGLFAGRGRYFLLLNSDVELPEGALPRAVEFMDSRLDVGMAGGALIGADGLLQSSYADFPTLGSECLSASGLGSRFFGPQYPSLRLPPGEPAPLVGWVPGACMLVRRATVDAIGGMDETYWMYSEDTDWCYRARQKGWAVVHLPDVRVLHAGGASTRQRRGEMVVQLYRSKMRFFAKHYGASYAATLRLLLWTIFSGRTLVSEVMLLVPPADRERWTRERDLSRLVRIACTTASVPASGA